MTFPFVPKNTFLSPPLPALSSIAESRNNLIGDDYLPFESPAFAADAPEVS